MFDLKHPDLSIGSCGDDDWKKAPIFCGIQAFLSVLLRNWEFIRLILNFSTPPTFVWLSSWDFV